MLKLDHVYNILYLTHHLEYFKKILSGTSFMQFIKRIIYKLDIRIHLMAPPWLCNVADSFIIYKDDCLSFLSVIAHKLLYVREVYEHISYKDVKQVIW